MLSAEIGREVDGEVVRGAALLAGVAVAFECGLSEALPVRGGTRLGATKVCKTVLEWQQMRTEHRETVEQFQRMNTSVGCPDGQATCQH